jgi:diguanylate cyclase (GGDEF)-like protein
MPNLMNLMKSAQFEMHRLRDEIDTTNRFSVTDQLTGAYNRYKFDDDVKNHIARYARYGEPFSLIILDIDHFKSINDTYGHAAGDQVLIELSTLIQESTRALETLYRMGGEEFIILVENSKIDVAVNVAEQLRKGVETFMFNKGKLRVTSSFGVAEFREPEEIGALVERADSALYEAKEGGRNRVAAAS